MTSSGRLIRVSIVLAAFAAFGCASSSGPFPSLSDYTDGASFAVGPLEALLRGEPGAEAIFTLEESPALRRLAAEWRRMAVDARPAEVEVVDFPPEPGDRASLTTRIRLEGFRESDPKERLFVETRVEIRLARTGGVWKILGSALVGDASIRSARAHLEEVAASIGLGGARHESVDPVEETNLSLPATHHHGGVVLADFDGDGSVDIVHPGARPRIFLNDGSGRFREATEGSGLDRIPVAEGAGGVAADLDGDGRPELFLTNAHAPCRLLHNEGGGRFLDVTAAVGLAALSGAYTSAVLFDADRDGRLDLFVACYGDARVGGPAYLSKNGPGQRFFHNIGRGNGPFFVDETESSGLGDRGWGFAASACDFDGDGDDDLYLACDFGANALFENVSTAGQPLFRDIAAEAGVLDDGYGMGVAWGDFDGDGRFDLHVSDFWSPYRWLLDSPKLPMPPIAFGGLARRHITRMLRERSRGDGLFRNLGDGTFERVSESAGVAEGGWAWGCEFSDLDGDGLEDLVVVNGMWDALPGGVNDEVAFWNGMTFHGAEFHDGFWGSIDFGRDGMASYRPKKLFRNLGGGRFEDRAFLEGFDTRGNARGLAVADLDGDLAPELIVSTFRGPLLVYRNGWSGTRRLRIRLVGAGAGNRDAIGATVRLEAGGKVQVREVRAGSSFLSQSGMDVLFGLGEAATADSIEIRWPDGRREIRRNVRAGEALVWTEGADE